MSLLPVEVARSRILEGVTPLESELVKLTEAHGRVSSETLKARRTQPPFDASAMDGYAIRFSDQDLKQPFRVTQSIAAGQLSAEALENLETARIFTGAPLPPGADTILIQENVTRDGDYIVPTEFAPKGRYVRKAGLDFTEGEALIDEFRTLGSADIALLASMNHTEIPVVRKPRIGIISTGDELVEPGGRLAPGQIIASNSYGIASRIKEFGAYPHYYGIARDSEAELSAVMDRAITDQCDALITLGGASVGAHDLVQKTLLNKGLDLGFWRIAMRPGKPLMFGRLQDLRFLGLPGNPVSSLVCTELFVGPLIKQWLGLPSELSFLIARLEQGLEANDNREDYIRAVFKYDSETALELPTVTPISRQDSSMLAAFARANCLIRRPADAAEAPAGSVVEILKLRDPE